MQSEANHSQSSKHSYGRYTRAMEPCCRSTLNRDVIKGNGIYWKKEDESMAIKVWKKASNMGIIGGDDEGVYVVEIKRMEQSDRERCVLKDSKKKATKERIDIKGIESYIKQEIMHK